MKQTLAALAAAFVVAAPAGAAAQSKEDERLRDAADIVDTLRRIPEQAIPPALLGGAHAVAVVPNVLKLGVAVGARRGRGVLSVRTDEGWSAPVFITLTGGSIGWQIGAQSADLVLVFANRRGVDGITSGKLTLGADAAVAAGPVGRQGSALTDIGLDAEVYSYSRARGLFAGVALEGAAIRIDKRANASFYVAPAVTAQQILYEGAVTPPPAAAMFIERLASAAGAAPVRDADSAASRTAGEESAQPEPETRTYGIGERPADVEPDPARPDSTGDDDTMDDLGL